MSNSPERPRFPERILVANIAHSEPDEVELEIVSDELEWGDLPTASYVREDDGE